MLKWGESAKALMAHQQGCGGGGGAPELGREIVGHCRLRDGAGKWAEMGDGRRDSRGKWALALRCGF